MSFIPERMPSVAAESRDQQEQLPVETKERERRPSSSASSSSSRSEHDRRPSGDQRRPPSRQDAIRLSAEHKRRQPSGSERRKHTDADFLPKPPPKPVLTQELENQIISGGDVFMKKNYVEFTKNDDAFTKGKKCNLPP